MLSGFDPGTRNLPAGFRIAPPFTAPPVDIVLEKDVAVTMRDGVTIYVDVLRPEGTEKVPVIVAWSPYGKGQGTSRSAMGVFGLVGLDNGIVSGLEKFEGPDPADWCAHGYAICNPDARGVANSEGDSVVSDRQEGQDCHDLIEWLAVQEWCTGKGVMSGTSYLAVVHRSRAASPPGGDQPVGRRERRLPRPPDARRHARHRLRQTTPGQQLLGNNRKEDILEEARRYPLVNDLWKNKIPRFDFCRGLRPQARVRLRVVDRRHLVRVKAWVASLSWSPAPPFSGGTALAVTAPCFLPLP